MKKLQSIVYNRYFEILILFLTTVSIFLLLGEKAFSLTPAQAKLIEQIDLIILLFFLLEFIIKIIINKKEYLINEFGWVDFLSIIPIFNPLLKIFYAGSVMQSTKILRVMRLIRIIRLLRFLKIARKTTKSPLKQKVFIPVSSIIMILVLVIGFFMLEYIDNIYNNQFETKIESTLKNSKNIEDVKNNSDDLLKISSNNNLIYIKNPDLKINQKFLKDELYSFHTNINNKNYTLLFDYKSTYAKIRKLELLIILCAILVIIILIVLLNLIINRIILNPVINLHNRFKSVVNKVQIPGTSRYHIEVNFEKFTPYESDDEIGGLSKSFADLLTKLKKQQNQTKGTVANICISMMGLFNKYHSVTRGHIYRSAAVASAIAYRMRVSARQREGLYFGMLLHDIGKMGIDKNVLTKDGKLTDEERKEIENHPNIGYEIALGFPLLSLTELLVIRDHHEKINGQGYPNNLSDKDLSLVVKIAAVADIFDALISPRDYKPAKSYQTVKEIMTGMAGTHIDKEVFDILINLIDENIITIDTQNKNENNWIKVDEKKLGTKIYFIDVE